MAALTHVFLTVIALILATCSSACLSTCRFVLCKSSKISLYSESDIPLTSGICLNGKLVGIVNTGEARVQSFSGKYRRISRIYPKGLHQKFSPHFLKAYALKSTKRSSNRGSGIGHEVPQRNQKKFLGGRCVALPVSEYQKLSRGNVLDNIHLRGRPFIDCVSFTVSGTGTTAPPTKPSTVPPTRPSTTKTEPTKPTEPTASFDPTKPSEPSTPVKSIPEFVSPGDTVEFPPTTKLNEKTSFKFKISVSAESGSSKEDFYLLSDATGSMSSAISEAKERFMDVVKARQTASTDVAFGVGFYRDEGEDPDFNNVQPITKNIAAVNEAIDSLVASGGGDFAEANLLALYEIAKNKDIGWRDGSRKILVYFGDAVGHEPSCVGDLVLRRDNVIAALKDKRITVVATSFSGDGLNSTPTDFNCPADEEPASVGQADAITKSTGGEVVDAEEQTKLIESILSSVGGLSQSLEADTSDCDAQRVEVSFDPKLPLSIDAGETGTVEETVKVSACSPDSGAFECMVNFTLGGANLGTQTLRSSALTGC